MILKGQLLSAQNLNNSYISKTDTNAQSINSTLTISGGALTLKNSTITDNASSTYMKISPQVGSLIIYDGVHNQQFSVYSTSGSEALYMTTIHGSPTYGQIDVTSSVDHLELMTATNKPIKIGGYVSILSGNNFNLVGNSSNDAGDIVFQQNNGTEIARIYTVNPDTLNLSTGTNTDAQISISDTSTTINNATTINGLLTATGGVNIKSSQPLSFVDYGGGFNMTDTSWIRVTGSKSFYMPTGTLRTDGTLQVGGGTTLNVDNGGSFNYNNGSFTIDTSGHTVLNGSLSLSTSKAQGTGIKLDGTTIDTVGSGGNIAIGGLNQIRFGTSTVWDWNQWAGIKYDSSATHLYIGGPSSSQFTANASPPTIDVSFTGVGHVGVGTDSPVRMLDVAGDIRLTNSIYSPNSFLGFLTDGGGALPIKVGSLSITSSYSNSAPSNGLYVQGNVGVGNTSPSYPLDVTGDIRATGKLWANANNTSYLRGGDDAEFWDINVQNTTAIYGVQNSAVGALKLGSTGPTIYGTGNMLGIGTTSPAYTLDVNGSIRLAGNNSIISGYNNSNDPILRDHNNGNVSVNGAGGGLYLGYQSTNNIILSSNLVGSNGSTTIATTTGTLYYQGQDTDTRYVNATGDSMSSDLSFSNQQNGIGFTILSSGGTIKNNGSWITGGNDTAGLSKINDVAIQTWWGFSVSPTVSGQNVPQGTPAFSVDARNGDTYLYRHLYLNNSNIYNINYLYGQYGTIARSIDEWLRINDDGSHTSGVYFGSSVARTDGQFQIGNAGVAFLADANGNITNSGNTVTSGIINVKNATNASWIGGLRFIQSGTTNYIESATTNNGSTSASLKLTGANGVANNVSTYNNTLDDSSGNMLINGGMTVSNGQTGNIVISGGTQYPLIGARSGNTVRSQVIWDYIGGHMYADVAGNFTIRNAVNGSTNIFQATNAGAVTTKNSTLDDGAGDANFVGTVTAKDFYTNGNSGIGTTSPANKLELALGSTRDGILISSDGNTAAYSDIIFQVATQSNIASGNVYSWQISHRKDGFFSNSTSSSLEFYGNRYGTGGYYAPLSFDSNGNVILVSTKNANSAYVGIGTTSPANRLDVAGGINTSQESHFSNGTYSDPHSGIGYGLKVSQGIATDGLYVGGSSTFNSSVEVKNGTGAYMYSDGTSLELYETSTASTLTMTNGGNNVLKLNGNEIMFGNGLALQASTSGVFYLNGQIQTNTLKFVGSSTGVSTDINGNIVGSSASSSGQNWNVQDASGNVGLQVLTDGTKKLLSYNNTLDDGAGNMVIGGNLSSKSGNLVMNVASSNVLEITTAGTTDGIAISGQQIQNPYGTGNLTLTAGSSAGFAKLVSPTNNVYIQAGGAGVYCVKPNTTTTLVPVYGSSFNTTTSYRKLKMNISETPSVLKDLKQTIVYDYQLIEDVERFGEEEAGYRTGIMIGEATDKITSRATPDDIQAVDLYSMISVLWRAVQELSDKIEVLEGELKNR